MRACVRLLAIALTILPDVLQVHLRSCNPDASGGGSKPVNRPRPTENGQDEADSRGRFRTPLANRLPTGLSMEQAAEINAEADSEMQVIV